MKPKKNKRSKTKYAALQPGMNLKIRSEEIKDFDYLDKLNAEEKLWLNNFVEEYINANLNHKGEILHKGKKNRRIVYNRNNARNRDSYSRTQSVNKLKFHTEASISENPEDMLIMHYDLKNGNVSRKRGGNKT